MPKHSFAPIRGTVDRFSFSSTRLNNQLGDPNEREIMVHWTTEGQQRLDQGDTLPVIIYLSPFTSSSPARAGWKAFSESILQRRERLVATGEMEPVFLVLPDSFTSLGGNQFVDTPIMGQWSTWLADDLCKELSSRYQINGKFSLVGKSSGGYGALVNAMLHPHAWVGIASHSGDVGFEEMFRHDFYSTVRRMSKYSSIEAFITSTVESPTMSYETMHDLMMIALASSYDPPASGLIRDLQLPLERVSGTFDNDAWNRWKTWDPLNMVHEHIDALSHLKWLYFDCGCYDQYNIHFGSRQLHELLDGLNISHEYSEFEGTHSGIDYRLDISLSHLSKL